MELEYSMTELTESQKKLWKAMTAPVTRKFCVNCLYDTRMVEGSSCEGCIPSRSGWRWDGKNIHE